MVALLVALLVGGASGWKRVGRLDGGDASWKKDGGAAGWRYLYFFCIAGWDYLLSIKIC